MYEISYFRPEGLDEDAKTPTDAFLEKLKDDNLKLYEKTLRSMWLLSIHGPMLRAPYTKYLREDILELRTEVGNDCTRMLFFYDEGKLVVVTHGFIKKTQKTPPAEIEKALAAKESYFKQKKEKEED